MRGVCVSAGVPVIQSDSHRYQPRVYCTGCYDMPDYVNDNLLRPTDEIAKQIVWNRRRRAVAALVLAALSAAFNLTAGVPISLAGVWLVIAAYLEYRTQVVTSKIAAGAFGSLDSEAVEVLNAALDHGNRSEDMT
jgi:hypothetical protein